MIAQRIVSLVLPTLIACTVGCDEKRPSTVETPPPAVMVAKPIERTVTDHQVFTARTQAVQSVDIKGRVTGYLTKILFNDGQDVKTGDVLFEIDDRPYKATLDQSKAAVAQGKAALDQAKASLELSKANLVKAQADYEIGQTVQNKNPGAISEQELVRRLGARDEAKAGVQQSTAGIPKAQAALEEAIASLETAQLNFDWCKVTSPITGRVNRHLVDVGNVVTKDTTSLTNVVSLRPIWAYFDVDQNTAERAQQLMKEGKIKAVRNTEIPVQMAIGADLNFAYAGVIDFLSNQLDPNTGSIRVRAAFPNADGSLVAGLFSRVRVPMTAAHPALLVADRAIGTDQGNRYILVVNDKNEVEYRAVEVGQLQSDNLREVMRTRTIVEPGPDGKDVTKRVDVLKPTDLIIVEGLLRVRPGVKVTPKTVDMLTLLSDSKK